MNLKTLNKKDAIHVLNLVSIVMAWSVTCYFFEAVTTHAVQLIGDFLMTPVYFMDEFLNLFTNFSISGHFNLMFLILWISYAIPVIACYPALMIKNHKVTDLHNWYTSKGSHS